MMGCRVLNHFPTRFAKAMRNLLVVFGLLAIAATAASASGPASSAEDRSQVSGSLGFFYVSGNHFFIGGDVGTTVSKNVMLSGELGLVPASGQTLVEMEGFGQYLINLRKQPKWQPFAGAGLGFGHASGGGGNSFKIDFVGGVRYFVSHTWGVRSDFRIGRFTNFHETSVRLTGGLFYNF